MLVAKGAPLHEKDNDGDGPMHWAAKRGDMEVMCTMMNAGACPKYPGEYDISFVCLTCRLSIIDDIIERNKMVNCPFLHIIRSAWQ